MNGHTSLICLFIPRLEWARISFTTTTTKKNGLHWLWLPIVYTVKTCTLFSRYYKQMRTHCHTYTQLLSILVFCVKILCERSALCLVYEAKLFICFSVSIQWENCEGSNGNGNIRLISLCISSFNVHDGTLSSHHWNSQRIFRINVLVVLCTQMPHATFNNLPESLLQMNIITLPPSTK